MGILRDKRKIRDINFECTIIYCITIWKCIYARFARLKCIAADAIILLLVISWLLITIIPMIVVVAEKRLYWS